MPSKRTRENRISCWRKNIILMAKESKERRKRARARERGCKDFIHPILKREFALLSSCHRIVVVLTGFAMVVVVAKQQWRSVFRLNTVFRPTTAISWP